MRNRMVFGVFILVFSILILGLVSAEICSDSEGTNADIYVKGSVTDTSGPQTEIYYDECIDKGNLKEFYCSRADSPAVFTTSDCFYGCEDGKCLGPARRGIESGSCSDSDALVEEILIKIGETGYFFNGKLGVEVKSAVQKGVGFEVSANLNGIVDAELSKKSLSVQVSENFFDLEVKGLSGEEVTIQAVLWTDYLSKGNIEGQLLGGKGTVKFADGCEHTGVSNILNEYYCYYGYVYKLEHNCNFGCKSGVCHPFDLKSGKPAAEEKEEIVDSEQSNENGVAEFQDTEIDDQESQEPQTDEVEDGMVEEGEEPDNFIKKFIGWLKSLFS